MHKTLLIMAAGLGSRYGNLKQMESIGTRGQWLMDYSIYHAFQAGFTKIICIIKPNMETVFQEHMLKIWPEKIHVITYVYQSLDNLLPGFTCPAGRTKPWGTGHAVWSAANVIDTPFMIINADDYYGPTAFKLISSFFETMSVENSYALVSYPLHSTLSTHGPVSRGICSQLQNDYLGSVAVFTDVQMEKSSSITGLDPTGQSVTLSKDTPTSMNCWACSPYMVNYMKDDFKAFLQAYGTTLTTEYYLPDIFDRLLRAGSIQIQVLASQDQWYGITYKDDLTSVRQALSSINF